MVLHGTLSLLDQDFGGLGTAQEPIDLEPPMEGSTQESFDRQVENLQKNLSWMPKTALERKSSDTQTELDGIGGSESSERMQAPKKPVLRRRGSKTSDPGYVAPCTGGTPTDTEQTQEQQTNQEPTEGETMPLSTGTIPGQGLTRTPQLPDFAAPSTLGDVLAGFKEEWKDFKQERKPQFDLHDPRRQLEAARANYLKAHPEAEVTPGIANMTPEWFDGPESQGLCFAQWVFAGSDTATRSPFDQRFRRMLDGNAEVKEDFTKLLPDDVKKYRYIWGLHKSFEFTKEGRTKEHSLLHKKSDIAHWWTKLKITQELGGVDHPEAQRQDCFHL
jgi:hypothetical protein